MLTHCVPRSGKMSTEPADTSIFNTPSQNNSPKFVSKLRYNRTRMTTATESFSDITSAQRKTLIAAAMGWALDAFDVMLYALVLAYIMRDLHMTKQTAGLLGTL